MCYSATERSVGPNMIIWLALELDPPYQPSPPWPRNSFPIAYKSHMPRCPAPNQGAWPTLIRLSREIFFALGSDVFTLGVGISQQV